MKKALPLFLFMMGWFMATAQTPCNPPVPAPTGAAVQTFCEGETLADLTVTGTNLTWYVLLGGTYYPVTPPSALTLVDGETYYVSQTPAGCESPYLAVTVTRSPGPPAGNPVQ